MTEPFLILHLVRGEPTFDIAEKIECQKCHGVGGAEGERPFEGPACSACEATGHWWIIPTSGHRARPWKWWELNTLIEDDFTSDHYPSSVTEMATPPPPNWPDHYQTTTVSRPERVRKITGLEDLGL